MITEDERDIHPQGYDYDFMPEHEPVSHEHTTTLQQFMANREGITNRQQHRQLQHDLVEHLWALRGGEE